MEGGRPREKAHKRHAASGAVSAILFPPHPNRDPPARQSAERRSPGGWLAACQLPHARTSLRAAFFIYSWFGPFGHRALTELYASSSRHVGAMHTSHILFYSCEGHSCVPPACEEVHTWISFSRSKLFSATLQSLRGSLRCALHSLHSISLSLSNPHPLLKRRSDRWAGRSQSSTGMAWLNGHGTRETTTSAASAGLLPCHACTCSCSWHGGFELDE